MQSNLRVALTLALLVAGCGAGDDGPNVLIVVLDTVRADALELDADGGATPTCRALAAEGTTFTHALAPGAWTVPTHASLFTGLLPHQHGARHGSFVLHDSLTTLAEHLAGSGYATGSFTTNPWLNATGGQVQGFAHHREVYRIADDVPDKGSAAAVDSVLAWLDRSPRRPFFAFLNLIDAHLPYAPTDEMLARIGADLPPGADREFTHLEHGRHITGEALLTPAEIDTVRILYAAGVAHVDAQLGRLVDGLRARGLLDETVVVVTSDHGEHLGEHGLFGHQFSLHEELLRIPLILRYPAAIEAGARCATPVSLVDVPATVSELTGRDRSWPVDGRSLLAAIGSGRDRSRSIVAEYARPRALLQNAWAPAHPDVDLSRFDRALLAIRRDGYKYVQSSAGEEWLFHLDADPGEARNLLDTLDEPTRARRDALAGALREAVGRAGYSP